MLSSLSELHLEIYVLTYSHATTPNGKRRHVCERVRRAIWEGLEGEKARNI